MKKASGYFLMGAGFTLSMVALIITGYSPQSLKSAFQIVGLCTLTIGLAMADFPKSEK